MPETGIRADRRALSPAVGTVLLVGIVALAAGAVAVLGAGIGAEPPDPSPAASIDAAADASTGEIALVHRGGAALDVRDLTVRIEIEGEPLAEQPPVPFFSAAGFRSGPTGPFNPAADPTWRGGERASVRLAGTNDPALDPGDAVTVRVYRDEALLAEASTTA